MASVFREFKFLQKKKRRKKKGLIFIPQFIVGEKNWLNVCGGGRGVRLDLKIFGGSLNFFSVVAVPNIPAEYLYLFIFFFSFKPDRNETLVLRMTCTRVPYENII